MSATLEQIEAQVRAYNPDADLTGLDDVFAFAQEAHEGQSRKSGEAFVNHPIEVALILAELHMDTATLKAALLHDVVEDSEVTLEEVRERFGDEVAELVDGVTKLGKIEFESLSEAQSNNLRKMLIAMAKDIRVILIKLADRLHNMRTLAALPPERQGRQGARDDGDLRAACAPSRHLQHQVGARGPVLLLPGAAQVPPGVAHGRREPRRAREAYMQQVIDELSEQLEAVGITLRDLRAAEAPVQRLPEDVSER